MANCYAIMDVQAKELWQHNAVMNAYREFLTAFREQGHDAMPIVLTRLYESADASLSKRHARKLGEAAYENLIGKYYRVCEKLDPAINPLNHADAGQKDEDEDEDEDKTDGDVSSGNEDMKEEDKSMDGGGVGVGVDEVTSSAGK